ncbi:MAG: PLP-dependent aminotransferase family protein [Acutalibacteraceae bacterium]
MGEPIFHDEKMKNKKKYILLYERFKKLISDGSLRPGDKLPSVRACAESFSLSRTTVETAYSLLSAEGYIIAKSQSGYYVSSIDFSRLSSPEAQTMKTDKTKSEIKYDLVSSSGDKDSFNFALWRRYIKSALRQDERLLSYGEAQGEYDLREAICSYVNRQRGVICSPEQIVIAAGTQSLIAILCAITKARQNVTFLGPQFAQGKAVFEDHGKKVSSAQYDALSQIPYGSIIYASPSHIDVWGSVLKMDKRAELLGFSKDNDCLIIEDDYDSEFRYYQRLVPSLQSLDSEGRVVYIGTFSKLLIPSIRISFMVLPTVLSDEYKKCGRYYNQTASKTEQIALCQYLRDGHLSYQIRKQQKQYMAKSRSICARAEQMFGDLLLFERCEAGYLIKVKMKTDLSSQELTEKALKKGIKIKPAGRDGEYSLLLLSVTGFEIENCDDMLKTLGSALLN